MEATAGYRFFASLLILRPVSGQQSRKTGGALHLWLLLAALATIALSRSFAAAPTKESRPRNVTPAAVNEVRRVLVFNDFDPIASPGVAIMDQAIFTAVSQSRYQIEWYDESLGANLFTDEASQRHIRE